MKSYCENDFQFWKNRFDNDEAHERLGKEKQTTNTLTGQLYV